MRKRNKKLPTKKNYASKINFRSEMLSKSKINLKDKYTAEYLINLLRAKTFKGFNGVTFKKNRSVYEAKIQIRKINDKI